MFKGALNFHTSELNETSNQSLTDLYLINHLTIYKTNTVHQKEAIYELLKEPKILIKFSNFGLWWQIWLNDTQMLYGIFTGRQQV